MPKCESCGSSVTRAYVRIMKGLDRGEVDGSTQVEVCPFCED